MTATTVSDIELAEREDHDVLGGVVVRVLLAGHGLDGDTKDRPRAEIGLEVAEDDGLRLARVDRVDRRLLTLGLRRLLKRQVHLDLRFLAVTRVLDEDLEREAVGRLDGVLLGG